MTLILSVVTRNYVVQVSDRRLTDANTGRPLDESANKAVVFCGHFVFGYTGLAQIDSLKTDMWLAERLLAKGPSAQANLEFVRDEATRSFQSVPRIYRKHAFIAVGWSRSRPVVSVISNYIDDNGHELGTAQDAFRLNNVALGKPGKFFLVPVGQPIPIDALTRLRRAVKRIVKHAGPVSMANLLIHQLWRFADENNRIGHDVMVSVIPRSAVPVKSIVMPSTPSNKTAAFYYVPSPEDIIPRFYTPMWACGGIAVGGGEVWLGRVPPWWKE